MGFLTFVGDVAKGVGAVLLGRLIAGEMGGYVASVAVVVGHNWPILLRFKGGKGIATSAGIVFVTLPIAGAILFVLCVGAILLTKYVSVGSMVGCIGLPIISLIAEPTNIPQLVMFLILAALGIFSHRANIKRLCQGNENRLDFKKLKP